jgi:hypothetical protein
MAVYGGQNTSGLFGQALNTRTYLSTNMQTGDDYTYNPSEYLITSTDNGPAVLSPPTGVVNVYTVLPVSNPNTVFYKEPHFISEGLIIDGGTLFLGTVIAGLSFFLGVFNNKNYSRTVQAVGIASASAGISVGNLSASDVFGPYEEISVELNIDSVGDAIINTVFFVKFIGDPVTYQIAVQGIRVKATYLLDMNWYGGTFTTRRFLTDVYQAGTSAETRKAKRYIPIRDINTPISYYNKETAIQARSTANICALTEYALPLYMDKAIATAASEPLRIYCPTEYRRFEAGGLVGILRKKEGNATDFYDISTISSVESDGLILVSALQNSYVQGDIVYPITICLPAFDAVAIDVFNDRSGEVKISSTELFGSGLELENTNYTPTLVRGIPVYPFDINYGESTGTGTTAQGEYADSGRGQSYYTIDAPETSYSGTSVFYTRAMWWDAVGFFNYIKGMFRKFWYTEPIDIFDVASYPSVTEIDIETSVSQYDIDFIRYIKMKDSAGSEQIVEVTNVAAISGGLRLTTESRTIGEPVNLRLAKLVRLSSDAVEEAWLTDAVVTISFEFMELPRAEI